MKTLRALIILGATGALLAACGRPDRQDEAGFGAPPAKIDRQVCVMLSPEEVAQILGAPVASFTEDSALNSPHPGCSWYSVEQPDGQRILTITVWRAAALEREKGMPSGQAFFADQTEALRAEFSRVGSIADVGDEGVMGLEPQDDGVIAGAILARKGEDVVSLSMQGVDPAAFEEAAARIAAAL